MLISNLLSHRQNQNLEIIPIYIVVLRFPHDNIVWIHLCDECERSNVQNVCHTLSSTSWWHEQVCSLTIKYQVYQFELTTGISEQFERILLIILQQRLFLLLWIDGRRYMELRLCVVVESFCLQVRNMLPRISSHDLPFRRTVRKCMRQVSRSKVVFSVAPAGILDSNKSL